MSITYKSVIKSKITNILNSEEKSTRKVPNHMAKSNDKTHKKRMGKNCHIRYTQQALQPFFINDLYHIYFDDNFFF